MYRRYFPTALFFLVAGLLFQPAIASAQTRQMIVGIAPSWESTQGKIQRFESSGGAWQPIGEPIPVLFGKNGLIWGIGLRGQEQPGAHKQERDGRAPAGMFQIGKIYTFDSQLPPGANYPFHSISKYDAWIDDSKHPLYNRHIVVDPNKVPEWFEKQKMKHNDFAHRWLVEIRHNSDPPEAGAGSAIFFHIRRGPTIPTAGCTTMAESNLVELMTWLDASKKPIYVLLPWKEYQAKWKEWKLPDPSIVAARPGGAG